MKIFLARQAIYDINMSVVGYEVLYRSSDENRYDPSVGEDKATYTVIQNISTFGLDELANSKDVYINFPQQSIENNIGTLLPRKTTIIEVLENVNPTEQVFESLVFIKGLGYRIALDDVTNYKSIIPFLELVDIVKVDIQATTLIERLEIAKAIQGKNITLLAEKIETKEELEECKRLGFTQFQGYYFSKPAMVLGNDIKLKNTTVYRLLLELIKSDIDVEAIDLIMKTDIVLTYKFLRFINSAYFSFVQEIRSIKQAIMLVGRNEMKKWLSVIAVTQMETGASEEYTNNTIIKAKLCELIAKDFSESIDVSSAFLVGLFSEFDLLIEKNMENVVSELPFKNDVKDALTEKENTYRYIYLITKSYEEFNEEQIKYYCNCINFDANKLGELYLNAIEWCNDLLKYK